MITGPVGSYVPSTRMADDCEARSPSLDPRASVAPRVIEVPAELLDEDLDWLNAHSLGVTVERQRDHGLWMTAEQIRG